MLLTANYTTDKSQHLLLSFEANFTALIIRKRMQRLTTTSL